MICAAFSTQFRIAAAQSANRGITFEPYVLRTYDGQSHNIELGRISVPESRARKGSPTITVAFFRLKSTNPKPGSPVVFLMGGPGIPATVMAPIPPYWELFDALRTSGDVILLDQRGLGLSSPKVDCPPLKEPLDVAFLTSRAALVSAYRGVIASCAEFWRAKGVDPRAFTDLAIADDVEDIRRALGVNRVSLLGFSYGTRLTMTYARKYPSRLDRVVLQGSTDGDLEYHNPAARDALLNHIAQLASSDTIVGAFSKNLVGRIRTLAALAGAKPLVVRIRRLQGDSVSIPVGGDAIRGLIEGHLTDARLPAFVATTERGDLTILTRWVESMYNDFSGGAGTLMARGLNCSARPSRERKAKMDSLATYSVLGRPFDNFSSDPEFCAALGGQSPPSPMNTRARMSSPTLFITGQLDDRTPLGNDELLANEFSHSVRLRMINGGHELLPYESVRKIVVDFFAGRPIPDEDLRDDPPRFLSIDEAKQPPRRRGA